MLTTAVFLDVEKAFDATWHLGLVSTPLLSKLKFLTGIIKPVGFFLSSRKFKVSVESEISAPR
jgi:hypothetical protein